MKQLFELLWQKRHSGGVLLIFSALLGKALGFLRDRLFTANFFASQQLDFVIGAFKIPDFFYFLLVSGTVGALLVPKIPLLSQKNEAEAYISSFLWGMGVFFGGICVLGILFTPFLLQLVYTGFSADQIRAMVPLSRLLFGSSLLLGLGSVLGSALQARNQFWGMAISPLLWTGSIIFSLVVTPNPTISTVGWGALAGGALQLGWNAILWAKTQPSLGFYWVKPAHAWRNFGGDFVARVFSSGIIQLVHLFDAFLASFLPTGAITSFSFGTALGQILLTIIGLSLGNAAFPILAKNTQNKAVFMATLQKYSAFTFVFTIPFAIIAFFTAEWVVALVFGLSGMALENTAKVFQITALSAPFYGLIPLLTRALLAKNKVKLPTAFSFIAATVSVLVAWNASQYFFAPEMGVLGLAWGTFVMNSLLCVLLGWGVWNTMRKS